MTSFQTTVETMAEALPEECRIRVQRMNRFIVVQLNGYVSRVHVPRHRAWQTPCNLFAGVDLTNVPPQNKPVDYELAESVESCHVNPRPAVGRS